MLSLQWTFFPLRNTNYCKSYTHATAIVIIGEVKLGLKQLAQRFTCAPGNNPTREPWALLSEFYLTNAPHISLLNALMLCT